MKKPTDVIPDPIPRIRPSWIQEESRIHKEIYNYLRFCSFSDLQLQMKRYLYRSNNIPMAVLGWKCPNQVQNELGGR